MPTNGERAPLCPLCGQPVRDQKAAIYTPEAERPAHFDCVVQELARKEALQPGEKITYLGKGVFGVVVYRPGLSGMPLEIRRRIAYEPPAPRSPRERTAGGSDAPPEGGQ